MLAAHVTRTLVARLAAIAAFVALAGAIAAQQADFNGWDRSWGDGVELLAA